MTGCWIADTLTGSRMTHRVWISVVATAFLQVAVPSGVLRAQDADPLVEARELYNQDRFDEAIQRAEAARRVPSLANAAAVVLARAHLEQYRVARDPASLAVARELLGQVEPGALTARDRVEHLIGLGETLYLEDPPRYAAAAEFFAEALARASVLDVGARDLVFTWWAGSLDRQAQFGPESGRRAIYARLLEGAERERSISSDSAAVWYWLVVGARGTGELERAIGLAIAGWIGAPQFGPRGAVLRTDLDRLMTDVVMPERARELAPGADPIPELALLQERWAAVKRDWP